MSGRRLSEEEFEEMLAAAGEGNSGDSVNSIDTEAYLQQQLDSAKEEEDAEIAEMSPEELFFSRHGLPASTEKAEQDKLEEELEELAEEYKPIMRRSDLASTTNRMRQSFAQKAFDNRSNPRDDDEFGGGKKRTIRKKNMGGSKKKYYYSKKHSTRKTKSRHRSKSLRKNKYQK